MQVGMQVGMQLEQEGGFTQHTLGRAERGPQWAVALGSSAERAAPCMAWYPHLMFLSSNVLLHGKYSPTFLTAADARSTTPR